MKDYSSILRGLLCLTGLCFVVGFILMAASPENIFMGIMAMIAGCILSAVAMYPAIKLIWIQKQKQEDRITKLEKEITLLKTNDSKK